MTAAQTPPEVLDAYDLDLPWTAPPLSLNHRNNWRVHAKKAAEIRQAAAVLAKQAKLGGPWAQIRVTLHYVPRDRRVRDAENPVPTLKAICDGLVDAGVVVDDDPAHMVKVMPVIHDPSGLKPRLWLVIEFLAGEAPGNGPSDRPQRARGSRDTTPHGPARPRGNQTAQTGKRRSRGAATPAGTRQETP